MALSSREAPAENRIPGSLSHPQTSLPEWIISIVPKMDGDFLLDLLAASVRAGRGLFLRSLGLPADLLLGLS